MKETTIRQVSKNNKNEHTLLYYFEASKAARRIVSARVE